MRVHILIHNEGSEASGTWSNNVAVFGDATEADAVALCDYLNGVVADVATKKITPNDGLRLLREHYPDLHTVYYWDGLGFEIETHEVR